MPKPTRQLRFTTVDDLRQEVRQLIDRDGAGSLSTTGNWPLGKSLGHLATWIEFSYRPEGAPVAPPWILKVVAKLMKRRLLEKSMPAGMKLGRMPEGTLGVDNLSTAEGASKLLPALDRLEHDPPIARNPLMGFLTHEEWIKLHLRHAELHLGYFTP